MNGKKSEAISGSTGNNEVRRMETILDPSECTLVAQVRKADASHRVETSTQLLRSKHFPGKSDVVYLGDMTTALLAHLPHPETPAFSQPPKYNEQRWTLKTQSSDLEVRIESSPYWAWGLLTSGYLNIIHLRGPLELRARLVLDTVSSLGQPPWEFAHPKQAAKKLHKHINGLSLKENERAWKAILEAARSSLADRIEAMNDRLQTPLSALKKKDLQEWKTLVDEDLHMAWQAHAEDNAPGVERALARLEAVLIQLNGGNPSGSAIVSSIGHQHANDLGRPPSEIHAQERVLHGQDDIPFVDLTKTSDVSEQE